MEGASTIMDPVDEVTFFGGGPDSDLSVVDLSSASGREGVEPQGVAADGAGGTTAGEGGAEVTAPAPPKVNPPGDPPKLKGEADAAGLAGVEEAAPKTGTAGDGFGDENGFAGMAAKGLDAAGFEADPPNVKGDEVAEGVDPDPDRGAADPKVNPPPKAGLGAAETCKCKCDDGESGGERSETGSEARRTRQGRRELTSGALDGVGVADLRAGRARILVEGQMRQGRISDG